MNEPMGSIIESQVEKLSAEFHDIYQQEAKRQGDVRHKDAYADLPENIKEFDRVLARFVLAKFSRVHHELIAGAIEACAKACVRAAKEESAFDDCNAGCHDADIAAIRSLTLADAAAEIKRIKTDVEAATIMRFRKMLDRIGIHGYYNEMQKEFGVED